MTARDILSRRVRTRRGRRGSIAPDLLAQCDPEVVALWKRHPMEEFEHRNVYFDTFHAVHGGYFLRVYEPRVS